MVSEGLPQLTMTRHPRIPALLTLAAVLGFGGAYLHHLTIATPSANVSLEQLEASIAAGKATKDTWSAYARRLGEAGRFADSALAWKKVLEFEPNLREARISRALALARGAGEDDFY